MGRKISKLNGLLVISVWSDSFSCLERFLPLFDSAHLKRKNFHGRWQLAARQNKMIKKKKKNIANRLFFTSHIWYGGKVGGKYRFRGEYTEWEKTPELGSYIRSKNPGCYHPHFVVYLFQIREKGKRKKINEKKESDRSAPFVFLMSLNKGKRQLPFFPSDKLQTGKKNSNNSRVKWKKFQLFPPFFSRKEITHGLPEYFLSRRLTNKTVEFQMTL